LRVESFIVESWGVLEPLFGKKLNEILKIFEQAKSDNEVV